MRRIVVLAAFSLLMVGCSERRPTPAPASDADKVESKDAVKKKKKATKPRTASRRIEKAFPAQVAGGFYTDNPEELRKQVRGFLDAASSAGVEADRDIVGVLAPHAGYRYSGPVAGHSYRAIMGHDYRTVVVMALSHRRSALKASVLDRSAYDTPLGSLKINHRLVRKLLDEHGDVFEVNEKIYSGEHSLEVQLPFIQIALPKADIVPIIVSVHDDEMVARIGAALFDVFGRRGDVVFAISSDLSHFFEYDKAKALDDNTLGLLEAWKIKEWNVKASKQSEGMCGYRPVQTFVNMFGKYDASKRRVTRLAYQNSGDTAGDKSRVVGYGALLFSLEKEMRTEQGSEKDFSPFTAKDRRYLMELAKKSVAAAAKGESFEPGEAPSRIISEKGAAFVTLKKAGKLRGCIGHVIARVPLLQCVSDVARSATIHDTRFSPVRPDELDDLSYEISVLTAPEPIKPEDVVVGRDGLIMERGGRSGLLLPQVPIEWGWNREQFLAHTCRKAGLPLDCWKDPDTKVESFRAIVWGEEDLED
ncbi:MAG: AmmeMemoRadiSam system protein B [Deltaproteobacteria bacterium]|nr:AmmeMemoRadiSam system protein B [Deltaproteobacteria bacterium]